MAILKPIADAVVGSWHGTNPANLFGNIDEDVASSADVITSGADTDTCKLKLTTATNPAANGLTIEYVIGANGAGVHGVVRLLDGTTVIESWTHSNLPTTQTAYSQTLTAAQLTGVNPANLYVEFSRVALVPPVPGTGSATFTLSASGAVTLGHGFKQGEFTDDVVPTDGNLQVTVKNRWPDGSVKFAVVAGIGTAGSVTLNAGAAVGGTAIAESVLIGLAPAVSVACGTFGTVTLASQLGSPFRQFIAGPRMSEWHYRAPVGSDTHLVVWFHVRLYSNNAIELEIIVENGYCKIADPGLKTYNATVTVNGTARFTQAGLNHYHHTRWSVNAWYGTNPAVQPLLDCAYLRGTKLVPNFVATAPTSAALNALAATPYVPMGIAGLLTGWGAPGSHQQIGVLPGWDALYITSNADARAYNAVLANARAGGSFSGHFRDENTNNPVLISQRIDFWLDQSGWFDQAPAPSGGNVNSHDSSHQPSLGFMAYLLTGKYVFLEEMQFWATQNLLECSPYNRQGYGTPLWGSLLGMFLNAQPRAVAWSIRTCAQAAALTPDSDTQMKQDLTYLLRDTWRYRKMRFIDVGGDNTNALGLLDDQGSYYTDYWSMAPWMNHFMGASIGYAWDLEVTADATHRANHQIVRDFCHSHSTGGAGEDSPSPYTAFSYRLNGMYVWAYANEPSPGVRGTYYPDWRTAYLNSVAMYNVHYGLNMPLPAGTTIMEAPNSPNLQMVDVKWDAYVLLETSALSYAVDHGFPGAAAGYVRFTSSPSWVMHSSVPDRPLWKIAPRVAVGLPTWMNVTEVGKWTEIQGTAVKNHSTLIGGAVDADILNAYSGFCVKGDDSTVIAHGGGHADYSGNEVLGLRLSADTPTWTTLCEPTPTADRIGYEVWWGTAPNQKPNASHTRDVAVFSPIRNRVLWFGHPDQTPAGGQLPGSAIVFSLDWTTKQWLQAADPNTVAHTPAGREVCMGDSGNIYAPGTQTIYRFKPDNSWELVVNNGALNWNGFGAIVYDSTRNRLLRIGDIGVRGIYSITLAGVITEVSALMTGSAVAELIAETAVDSTACCYDPVNDRFLVPYGRASNTGGLYAINAGTWAVTIITPAVTTGSGSVPVLPSAAGAMGRLKYVPQFSGVVYIPDGNFNAWFLRLA